MTDIAAIEKAWREQSTFTPPTVLLAKSRGRDYAVIDDSQSVYKIMSSPNAGEQIFATAKNNCTRVGNAYECNNLSVISCRTKSDYDPREKFVLMKIIPHIH